MESSKLEPNRGLYDPNKENYLHGHWNLTIYMPIFGVKIHFWVETPAIAADLTKVSSSENNA